MRIRVPRRFLLLGILLCSLALVVAPLNALAKPIPWNPADGPAPGDGDGTVVKGGTNASAFTPISVSSSSSRITPTMARLSIWKAYLTVLRLGYGWRWLW